jgi:predicted permease
MGAGQNMPLVGWSSAALAAEGQAPGTAALRTVQGTAVSPDFFRTMGIALLAGRDFREADERGLRVAIVDETLVKQVWPGADPIGRRLRLGAGTGPQWLVRGNAGSPDDWSTVVGVVSRIKGEGFDAMDAPHVYFPIGQRSHYGLSVFVRTPAEPDALRAMLQREVAAVDADLPLFGVRTMDEIVSRSLAERRFTLVLLATFALLALGLAGLGVYGITSQTVALRTREMAIRLALGAAPADVARLVAGQAALVTAGGSAIGLIAALVLTRFLRTMLFEAAPIDPWAYLGALLLLAAAAVAASYPTVRRASRADPMAALRRE